MTAGYEADEDAIDHFLLAYDDFSYFVSDCVQAGDSFVKDRIGRHNLILDET